MKLMIPAVLGFIGASSCCCCGDLVEKVRELAGQSADLHIDADGDDAPDVPDAPEAVEATEGSDAAPAAQLDGDGVAGLPAWPGAKLQAHATMGSLESATYELKEGDPATIVKSYMDKAKAGGWAVSTHVDAGETSTFQAKKDGGTLTVTCTKQGDTRWLVMALQK